MGGVWALMSAQLVIVPQAGEQPARPEGVTCQRCSEYFGFLVRPKLTIVPKAGLRLASGAIVIDNPTVVCANCADRGIETKL